MYFCSNNYIFYSVQASNVKSPDAIMSADTTYQKPLVYNKFLPYASQLNEEGKHLFEDIKRYLSIAVQKSELWPGAIYWTQRLNRYSNNYPRACMLKG